MSNEYILSDERASKISVSTAPLLGAMNHAQGLIKCGGIRAFRCEAPIIGKTHGNVR